MPEPHQVFSPHRGRCTGQAHTSSRHQRKMVRAREEIDLVPGAFGCRDVRSVGDYTSTPSTYVWVSSFTRERQTRCKGRAEVAQRIFMYVDSYPHCTATDIFLVTA